MNLRLQDGLLNCSYGKYGLSNLKATLDYRGDHYNVLSVNSGCWNVNDKGNEAKSIVEQGEFTLKTKKTNGGVSLALSFKASASFSLSRCHRLIIKGFLPVKIEKLHYNFPQVEDWVRNFEMSSKPITIGLVDGQREESAQYSAFKTKNNIYGVLGFVTFNNFFSEIALNQNGEFEAYANLEERPLRPLETIKTDECWINIKRNQVDILSSYGKRIAKANGVTSKCELPTGWCSWYYYGRNISHDTIMENVRVLKRENIPVKYIQIDSGWQQCFGDWTENENFPYGMKTLADQIKEQGFVPGIWVAPFNFEPQSKTFHEHPEFFVRDEKGEILPNRLIDYSKKEAREWLYNLARKLSVEWGYRYIKIDLITYRLAKKGYSKHGFSPIKNFREAIKIIRSAVTPDTVLLTCTSPIGASAGIAESVRTSDDIFERWSSLRFIAKQNLSRYFVSQYINPDPDCLMVRTIDKHQDDAFRYCIRDEREIQTFINFMSACGGALMLSDKLTLLDDGDFNKIRTLFPINTTPAIPIDLFEREVPSILYYGKRNGLEIYALFNWSNVKDTLKLDFKSEKFVKTFYSNEKCKATKYQITLEPHASEIIYVADNEELFTQLGTSIMPN